MANFCSECGFNLESKVNFCPNCGSKITGLVVNRKDPELQDDNKINKLIIVCENCGDENTKADEYCKACGAALKGSERKVKSYKVVLENEINKSRNFHNKKTKKASHSKAHYRSGEPEKTLDPKKIYLISSIVLILVLIILFSSGVFDSSTGINNVNENENPNNNAGIDLNNLNTINELEAKVNANPADYETLLHLAHLQNDSRMYEKAIQNYKKYLESNPQNADARVDMGICYYNLGDYPSAIKEMEMH